MCEASSAENPAVVIMRCWFAVLRHWRTLGDIWLRQPPGGNHNKSLGEIPLNETLSYNLASIPQFDDTHCRWSEAGAH